MSQVCPICAASLEPQSRYPRYVCWTCASRARSADGRPLAFANEGFDGGYVATYADRAASPTTATTAGSTASPVVPTKPVSAGS